MPEDKEFTDYKSGDITSFGVKIDRIIDASIKAIVFWDSAGRIAYQYGAVSVNSRQILNKYKELSGNLSYNLPEKQRKRIRSQLASCLFSALNEEDDEAAMSHFSHISKLITSIRTPAEIKAYFVTISIICSCSIAAALAGTFLLLGDSNSNWSIVIVCAAAGTIGTLFSILQRNREIEIELSTKNSYILMQVLSHVFFGAFSGAILFIASKGNLAFGFAQQNVYALITLSVISGFSERFIPDMFNKIISRTEKNATSVSILHADD